MRYSQSSQFQVDTCSFQFLCQNYMAKIKTNLDATLFRLNVKNCKSEYYQNNYKINWNCKIQISLQKYIRNQLYVQFTVVKIGNLLAVATGQRRFSTTRRVGRSRQHNSKYAISLRNVQERPAIRTISSQGQILCPYLSYRPTNPREQAFF